MSRGKELLKNTGILMVAKISTQIISFFLLPLYTSLLSTEQYGRVDIITSLAMILLPLITLQVEMALFRFFITSNDVDDKRAIVSSSVSVVSISLLVFTAIFILFAWITNLEYATYIYGYYVTQTFSTVLMQMCRAEGDNVAYGSASFISSLTNILLNIWFIVGLGLRVEGILLSSIIAQIIGSIFMIYRTKIYRFLNKAYVKIKYIKRLLNYSVPLVFNQIASWAINYSDRLIILAFWGESANGIYSIANKFSNVTNTFFGVYNVAWTENVVRTLNDDDNAIYISRMFEITFNVYLALVTGIINLLPLVFDFFVNRNFREAYLHVPILLVAMFFSGMAATIGSIYIAYNKTKDVSITTMLAGVCNVAVHFALLSRCKLFAASLSTLVSFGALFVYRFIFVKKFFDLKIHFTRLLAQLLILIISWAAYISENRLFILIGLVLNLIYIGLWFKSNKESVLSLFKKK